MAIISISRQLGSLGTKIAKDLREKEGFNYLDKILFEEGLADKYGLSEDKIKHYDEKKPTLRDTFSSDKDQYLNFLKTTMYDFACKGHCIIIGRGGLMLFQDIPGTLHIRIIAPPEIRLERIKEQFKCDDHLANQIMKHSDHDRAGFHKFFFHVNWDDSQLYDLTINTKNLTVDAAVKQIKDAIDSTSIMNELPEKCNKLVDKCLSQKVYTSIVYTEKLPIQFFKVVAESGVVTLQGAMTTSEDIKRSEEIARTNPDVTNVINELHFIRTAY